MEVRIPCFIYTRHREPGTHSLQNPACLSLSLLLLSPLSSKTTLSVTFFFCNCSSSWLSHIGVTILTHTPIHTQSWLVCVFILLARRAWLFFSFDFETMLCSGLDVLIEISQRELRKYFICKSKAMTGQDPVLYRGSGWEIILNVCITWSTWENVVRLYVIKFV